MGLVLVQAVMGIGSVMASTRTTWGSTGGGIGLKTVPPLVHDSLTSTEGEKVHIIYFQTEQNIYKGDKYRVGG